MDGLGVGRDVMLRITQFQPPAVGWDTSHQSGLLKAPSSLDLNTSWDGASTSLGNLCQWLTTLSKGFLPHV